VSAFPSLESRIGEVVRSVRFSVEPGKISELARAMGDSNPLYHDQKAARGAGFAASPAPATFTIVAAHFAGGDAMELPRVLGLDLGRVVHGGHGWTFHRLPIAGDVLAGNTELKKVERRNNRQGNAMTILTLETQYFHADGSAAVTEQMVMIELPRH